MHLSLGIVATCIALACFQSSVDAAIDPQAWYTAHPGMAKIGLVDQSINQITDEHGRVRFFHGTNVVKKSAPWYRPSTFKPGDSFGPKDVANLQALGVNAVRLGHHWAGSEPIRGQYNQTFLDIMKQQTKLAEDHGIYVLVDVHQDVLASQLCGHGVPDWFVQRSWVPNWKQFPFPQKLTPFSVNDKGIPSDSDCNSIDWSLSYLTTAVGNAFGRLYNNYDNLGDAFAAYWAKLAQQYVNTQNILGYNLLNEPWVGDTWADPTLLTPGVADHKTMEALWNRATTKIRTIDKNTLIFFEGATLDVLSGFNDVPLGDGSRSVHSFHYYNPPQLGSISDTLKNRIKDNVRLKTAGMLTEFTFWLTDDAGAAKLQEAVNAADQYMMSWMGWAYENLYDGNGVAYPGLAKHYSRAYPAAVAGVPTKFAFNPSDSSFSMTFNVKKSVNAPSEIILPVPTYPNGYNVSISPSTADIVQYKLDDRTLALFNGDSTTEGQTITVNIKKL
ncbi:glycoside hydrolase family 5 protein [Mucor lusitanicus]|uniref:Glycoside hydrolase family 5 protein n=2 Tax=Mucor circinelloides f. lusitanicus TaxID=29924 RepID=A0A162YLN3_MUCCL|nr:glycoside hydrolase family 5 protein [Mucor lusitanicus]OAC99306.1 glycoside hydrolase family 5 protein [Mucor lusitanicus CBS 277.49]